MIFSVRLWFQSVQHALQHDFAWVNDEADHSVVLDTAAGCPSSEVRLLRTGSMGLAISSLPDLIADCREGSYYILSTCLGQFCWDVVDSSRLTFLKRLYYSLHFFAKDGVVILCVGLGTIHC